MLFRLIPLLTHITFRRTVPLKLSFTNIRGRTQRVGLQETSKLCQMQLKKYSYS
jgi:hypothetical protein